MNNISTNAFMDSNREVFRNSPPAFGTCLGCWGKEFILNKLSSSTLSLVGQHVEELSPGRICDMFSKTMIFEHSVNIERFNANEAISISNGSALLMEKVHPLIGNFNMTLSNLIDCLPSIGRTFLLPAQSPLELLELSFRFDKEAWIRDCFPIAQSGKVLNAHINTDFILWMWMSSPGRFNLAGEYSEPLPSTISLNCQGLDFPSRKPMQDNRNISYLGKVKSFVGKHLEPRLWICDTLNPLLKAWKTKFNPLALLLFLNPAKEMSKCFRKSISTVLKNLRVDLFELRIRFFNLPDDGVEFSSTMKRNLLGLVGGFASLKKKIIHLTAQVKLREQSLFLFSGRVQPILIVPQLHGIIYDSIYKWLAFIPQLKLVGFPASLC